MPLNDLRLAEALDAHRSEYGYSWNQLARRLGLATSTLTGIGREGNPTLETVEQVTRWMGRSIDEFLCTECPDFQSLRLADTTNTIPMFEVDDSDPSRVPEPVPVEGVIVWEGRVTGDGRMIEPDSLTWDDTPIPILWDRTEGDHTGVVVGSIHTMERQGEGVWASGFLSASEDADTMAAVTRVAELLAEGAVGVSVMLDSESMEIRISSEAMERMEAEMAKFLGEESDSTEPETDAEGRTVVAKWNADDELQVTTAGRIRHVAIVDTAAFNDVNLSIPVVEGLIAASGSISLAGDWSDYEHYFDDPRFTIPGKDGRLRFDPQSNLWSCPVTVDGSHVFGHVAPTGLCLRGRPDTCITPPDGDLEGFMRHYAPAAGGRRTGVIMVSGSHAPTGVGIARATSHYDKTGDAVADVRIGKDAYGIWFSGMIRPGAKPEDVYALSASDVSGHWEIDSRGRPVLVGLPAVNVGGFPKGYLTAAEVEAGLAASASLPETPSTGTPSVADQVAGEVDSYTTLETDSGEMLEIDLADIIAKLDIIVEAVTPMYAARLAETLLATPPSDEVT